MEISYTRNQLISLILNDLLNGNYDCIILILNLMNQFEIKDSINYHIQQSLMKNNIFSTYSFLYTIKGFDLNNLKIQREKKKKFNKKLNSLGYKKNVVNKRKCNYGALSYYDKILSNKNLTKKQRDIFIRMKQKRLDRLFNH